MKITPHVKLKKLFTANMLALRRLLICFSKYRVIFYSCTDIFKKILIAVITRYVTDKVKLFSMHVFCQVELVSLCPKCFGLLFGKQI